MAAPPSQPLDNDQFVKDVFKRAKESVGAKAHEEERERRTEERFIGSGYRLGGDGVESAQVAGQRYGTFSLENYVGVGYKLQSLF